jgi:hypothetical protein
MTTFLMRVVILFIGRDFVRSVRIFISIKGWGKMLADDVGYGSVKAVSEAKRVMMMPSVVSSYREGQLADVAGIPGKTTK